MEPGFEPRDLAQGSAVQRKYNVSRVCSFTFSKNPIQKSKNKSVKLILIRYFT